MVVIGGFEWVVCEGPLVLLPFGGREDGWISSLSSLGGNCFVRSFVVKIERGWFTAKMALPLAVGSTVGEVDNFVSSSIASTGYRFSVML